VGCSMLIKMVRVCEIIGVHETAIRQKVNNGSFPKPAYNKEKKHLWSEKEVIQWLERFEERVLFLYSKGYKIGTIAVKSGAGAPRVKRVIEKYKAEKSNIERVNMKDSFDVFLKVSANLGVN